MPLDRLAASSALADPPADLHALFAAFVDGLGPFTQAHRLLRLSVVGLAHSRLIAWRVAAEEAVSADYRLDVEVLCDDVHLELKSLIGRVAELGVLLPNGGERLASGLIAEAAQTGADGGFARYRLRVVPGFALLAHRRDSRVFQDQSVPQIVDAVLAAHRAQGGPFAAAFAWRFDLSRDYPPRSYCLQYRESDHDFLQRLLAEEGIATRYEFVDGDGEAAGVARSGHTSGDFARGDAVAGDGESPTHTLVCFDDPWSAPPCAQPRVRFHRADASEDDDTLTTWQATRRLRAGRSTLASFDYKPASTLTAGETGAVDQGDHGAALETLFDDYDAQALYYAADGNELAAYARRRQDARDRTAKDQLGESTVRAFAAGTWFELRDHPRHDGRHPDEQRFLIRELVWQARNNLPAELAGGLAGLLAGGADALAAGGTDSQGAVGAMRGTGAIGPIDLIGVTGAAGAMDAPGAPGAMVAMSSRDPGSPPYRNRLLAVRRDTPVAPAWATTEPAQGPLAGDKAAIGGAAVPRDPVPCPPPAATMLRALTAHRMPQARPTAPGPQTATVIGPAGEAIHTDALGRIQIRFHWQRANPSGAAEDPNTTRSAAEGSTGDDAAAGAQTSCWLRVATPWAGQAWGQLSLPRVGQEVLVGFIEGDIDRPVIIGSLYNGSHAAPAFGGAGSLPANRALAGIKSCELPDGPGGNQLVFDDTTGQVRTQLASSHAASELNLGYLISPRREGEGEPRGEGFELRTDAGGAIRAGKGLMISADARPAARGGQLARREALAQLDAVLAQAKLLSRAAHGQLADATETGADGQDVDGQPRPRGHQTQILDDLKAWEAGSNTASNDSVHDGARPGGQSIVLASAPAGIALATPNTTHRASGQNYDQIAGRDQAQTTARRWLHNVGERISLFVRGAKDRAAIKLFAAQGDIAVQAQGGKLDLAAQRKVTFTAINGEQLWAGQKEVLLTCGGAYVRIAGGDVEIHAPGKVVVKGAGHEWGGAGSEWPNIPELPISEPALHSLRWKAVSAVDGRPIPGIDVAGKAEFSSGVTGSDGRSEREFLPETSGTRAALIGDGDWVVEMFSDQDPVMLERDGKSPTLEGNN